MNPTEMKMNLSNESYNNYQHLCVLNSHKATHHTHSNNDTVHCLN